MAANAAVFIVTPSSVTALPETFAPSVATNSLVTTGCVIAPPTKNAVDVAPILNVIVAVLVAMRVTVSSIAIPVVVETGPLREHSMNALFEDVELVATAPVNIPPQAIADTVNSAGTWRVTITRSVEASTACATIVVVADSFTFTSTSNSGSNTRPGPGTIGVLLADDMLLPTALVATTLNV